MPKVIYHLPDGTTSQVNVEAGQSIMDGSIRNNLPGIVAECGGSCACATCHVHIAGEYDELFAEPSDEEADLIAYLDGADDQSRLACQLIIGNIDTEIHIRVADNR